MSTAVLAALAEDLRTAGGSGFRVEPLAALLGPVAHGALGRDELLPAERMTRDRPGDPLAVLTRLWLLGLPVARGALDAALPRSGAAGAEAVGLVETGGLAPDDEVRPLLELTPYAADDDEWWLASDLTHTGRPLRPDHVLGVGGASTTLARWTPRTPVRSALDIGTGCGVQAFVLATHAAAVTATDTSARCLRVARLNASLNAAAVGGSFEGPSLDLDLLDGSLLDPVRGRRFDLVVSNPPFVITPRPGGQGTAPAQLPAYSYRDGGLVGDEVVQRLVEGIGSVLEPGGAAVLLGNWEHRRGRPWPERVGEWLDASRLHGWVVQREVQDPAEYAETWARDGGHQPGSPEYSTMYAGWLDDFDQREVEAIGFGVIALRRPVNPVGAQRVRRIEEHSGPVSDSLGPTVSGVLAAEEWLLATADDELFATRLTVAGDVTEGRFGAPGAPDPAVILLRQGGGLQRSVRADTALAGVVGACDGELPLGLLVDSVAQLLEVDGPALRQRVVPAVRRLVADGFLTHP